MRALAAVLFVFVSTLCYAKPLISKGDITVEQVGGCDEAITLQVNAPDGNYFTKQSVALQKLLGGARMALSFQCAGFKQINVKGVAAGSQVYTGKMAAASGWRLKGGATQAGAVAVAPATATPPTSPPAASAAAGFGSPKPDYSSAFQLVMATHSDILASDDAWVKGWASYHLFDSAAACYEWSKVEGQNPLTWKKQLDETRAEFRAALTASAGRPTTATYSLFDGIFTPQYDASKGGFLVKAFVNNDGTVRTLPYGAKAPHAGACVPAPPIPIRLTNLPKKPEWFIAMGEAEAEDFIDRTTNLTQGAKPDPNSQTYLNVQVVVQTLPPVFSNGKIHIPAKVLNARLAVVKTTQPKAVPKPGVKVVAPPKIETVGWTFPLGMPSNIAAAPDTGGGEVPILGRADFFLTALKHQPELLTDKLALSLTLNQLYQEQRNYENIDRIRANRKTQNRPALAEVLFVWQIDRAARPEIASRMIDALLHADPDWSYLKAGGYDERKESLVANFLFSREAIMGHDAKFLQHELKDVMRDFLVAAAARTPSEFGIDYDVPIKYDYASGMLGFDPQGKPSIKQEQPLYFDEQPANSKEYGGNVYPTAVRDDFLYRPPRMSAEQVAGANYPGGGTNNVRSLVAPRDAWPMLGFKQQLALADTAVPKAKAEQFVSSGRVTVRVIASFDGAALGAGAGGSVEQRALFAVLRGSVERLEFVDRKGRVQFTKAGSSLRAARDGIQFTQPSSATPNPIVLTRDVMDLLLLKNAPEKVDDDYLFSMMLARYSTDAASEDENWLRFFAPLSQAGRQPTEQEMRELMPQFRKWVQGRAALVNEVVATMYLNVTPGTPPTVTHGNSPQSCLRPAGFMMGEPDPQQTTLTLGPCGKRGKLAGEVRGLPGIKVQPITKLYPAIRIPGQLPVTAAIGAGGRTSVKAQLRLRFTGVMTYPSSATAHGATLEEIRYLDATSDAEIASISGAEAAATAQAAATAKATARASQRAACEGLVGVDEQMACFKANCDALFDDIYQCQNYINKFINTQRMRVQVCGERATRYQLVDATPAYDAAVQSCLTEPPRSLGGPDVLGIQIGMEFMRADKLVRSALDFTSGAGSRGLGDTIDKRPFTYLMLFHTEDTNHAIALFYLDVWTLGTQADVAPSTSAGGSAPQENSDEMSFTRLVAGISRKVHFESAPPAGAVRDGLVKKYGKPTWENGGTEMMWAKSASCRGLNELLVPLVWRARFWPADRTVRMVSPEGPQAAFQAHKDCGPVVFASLKGNDLETLLLDPDWFNYLPEKAFKIEKSSELQF